MARLSYAERLKRLEKRRDELIKITLVVAYTGTGGSIRAHCLDSRGRTTPKSFQCEDDLMKYIKGLQDEHGNQYTDCMLDDRVIFVGTETTNALFQNMTHDMLQNIADDTMDEEQRQEFSQALYKRVTAPLKSAMGKRS